MLTLAAVQCLALLIAVLSMLSPTTTALDIEAWNVSAPLLSRFDYAVRRGAAILPPFAIDGWALVATATTLLAVNVSQPGGGAPSTAFPVVGYTFPLPAMPTSFFSVDNDRTFGIICETSLLFFAVAVGGNRRVSLTKTFTFAIGRNKLNFTIQPETIPNQAPLIVGDVIYIGGKNLPESYNCSILAIHKNGTLLRAAYADSDDCNYVVRQDLITKELFFQVAVGDLSGEPNRIFSLFHNFSVRNKFSVLRRGEFQFQPRNGSVTVFYELGDIAYFNETGDALELTNTSVACGLVEYPIALLNGTYFALCSGTILQFAIDNTTVLGQWTTAYNYKFWVNTSTPDGQWLLVTDEAKLFTFNTQTGLRFRGMLTRERQGRPVGITWVDAHSFFLALTTNEFGGGVFRVQYPSFTVSSQIIGELQPVGPPLVVPSVERVFVANALAAYDGVNALEGYDMAEHAASFAVNTFDPTTLGYPFVTNRTTAFVYYASSTTLYKIHRNLSTAVTVGMFSSTIFSISTEPVLVNQHVCIHDDVKSVVHCIDTVRGTALAVAVCTSPYPFAYKQLDVLYDSVWLTCGQNQEGTFQRVTPSVPGNPLTTVGRNGGLQSALVTPTAVFAYTSYDTLARFNLDPSNGGAVLNGGNPVWSATVQGTSNTVLLNRAANGTTTNISGVLSSASQLVLGAYTTGYVLLQLNASSGAVLKTTTITVYARFVIAKVGGIFGAAGVVYLFEDQIVAVNMSTNALVFTQTVPGIMYAAQGLPVVGNDGVLAYFTIVEAADGNATASVLTTRNGLSGRTMWNTSVDVDACFSRIQVANGHLIFSDAHNIIAANPLTGQQYSAFGYTFGLRAVQGIDVLPTGPPWAPVNATLVVGSQTGIVFAGVVEYRYANPNAVVPPKPTTGRPSTAKPAPVTTAAPLQPTTARPSTAPPGVITTGKPSTALPGPLTTGAPAQITTAKPNTSVPALPPTAAVNTARPTTAVPEQPTTGAPAQVTSPRPSTAGPGLATTAAPAQLTTAAPNTAVPLRPTTGAPALPTTGGPAQVTTAKPNTSIPGLPTTAAVVTTAWPNTVVPVQPTTVAPAQVTTPRPSTAVPGLATTAAPALMTTATPNTTAPSPRPTDAPVQVTTAAPGTAVPGIPTSNAPDQVTTSALNTAVPSPSTPAPDATTQAPNTPAPQSQPTTAQPSPTAAPPSAAPSNAPAAPSIVPSAAPQAATSAVPGAPTTGIPVHVPTSKPSSAAPALSVAPAATPRPFTSVPATPVPTPPPTQDADITTAPSVSASMLQAMLAAKLGGTDTVFVDPTPTLVTSRNVTYAVTFINATEAYVGITLVNQGALGPLVLFAAADSPPPPSTPGPRTTQPLWKVPSVVAGVAAAGTVFGVGIVALVVYKVVATKGGAAAASAAGGASSSAGAATELDYVPMESVNRV